MQLQAIKDSVTVFDAPSWDLMLSRQAALAAYWQGLSTHTVMPSHTATLDDSSVSDQQTVLAGGQTLDWLTFWPEIASEVCSSALHCDIYDGPQGSGFVLVASFRYEGALYEKARNEGPETDRTFDWREVDETED